MAVCAATLAGELIWCYWDGDGAIGIVMVLLGWCGANEKGDGVLLG